MLDNVSNESIQAMYGGRKQNRTDIELLRLFLLNNWTKWRHARQNLFPKINKIKFTEDFLETEVHK